jgi:hypothetical protein
MSILTDTWHQLVRRRLLPVAGLLLAALAAVPFALAKDPEPLAPAPAVAPSVAKDEPLGQPIVALATGETRRRRVLGARKDPFQPAPAPKAKVAKAATPQPDRAPAGGGGTTTGGGTSTGGGTTTGGGTSGGGGTPATPAPAPVAPYSLTVRFGPADADLQRMNVERLQPLPDEDDPAFVYLGLSADGKSAVFMVDSTVVAQGDGRCKPEPADCETVSLRPGETEFFDVTDDEGNVTAQYQLDLLKINRSTTASASKALASRAAKSRAGRRVLKAIRVAAGPLAYGADADTAADVARAAQLFGVDL